MYQLKTLYIHLLLYVKLFVTSYRLRFSWPPSMSFIICIIKSGMTGVSKCLQMNSKKFFCDLIYSKNFRHICWYKNQSCSGFLVKSMLNVLLKNDDSSGFNGGSFSRYEYSNCSVSASDSSFSSRDGRPLYKSRNKTYAHSLIHRHNTSLH